MIIAAVLSFVSGVFCAVDNGSILHSGEATFYGDGGGGNCGYEGEIQPMYHGAMNHTDYDSSAACGTWVHIIGPKGEVTAFIDDRCPECKPGDIDLGPGTFETIADKALGRVPITWRYVEAPVKGPLKYYWQQGSSAFHVAIQIRNHRYAIASVEIRNDTSAWLLLDRSNDNFFFRYGGLAGAAGPYTVRVTDIYGQQVVDIFPDMLPGQVSAGKLNFNTVAIARAREKVAEKVSGYPLATITKAQIITSKSLTVEKSSAAVRLYSLSGRSLGKFPTSLDAKTWMESNTGYRGVVIVIYGDPARYKEK
jgi:expansin (peptidoglycan-binding protein)